MRRFSSFVRKQNGLPPLPDDARQQQQQATRSAGTAAPHARSASFHAGTATPPLNDINYNAVRRSQTQAHRVHAGETVAASPPPYDAALRERISEEQEQDRPRRASAALNPAASPARSVLPPIPQDECESGAENPLRALARYDVVFVIDDSGSMKHLWRQARDALMGVIAKTIIYDKDGVDVFFLNSERSLESCNNITAVERLFDDVRPRGSTPTAFRMDEILRPYVDRVEDAKNARLALPKPMVLICITDGRADDPETLKDIIIEMAGRLDVARVPPFQLGIQFLQIGSDPDATAFLQELDDDLKAEHSVRDMVDTIEYKGTLDSDFILKSCLGSINRRMDAQGR